MKKRLVEIEKFLNKAPSKIEEFDEDLVRKYIDGVKFYDDHINIMFKAGLETNIARIEA